MLCVYGHSWRPEEGAGPPWCCSCKRLWAAPDGCWKLTSDPLEKQQLLWSAVHLSRPHQFCFPRSYHWFSTWRTHQVIILVISPPSPSPLFSSLLSSYNLLSPSLPSHFSFPSVYTFFMPSALAHQCIPSVPSPWAMSYNSATSSPGV